MAESAPAIPVLAQLFVRARSDETRGRSALEDFTTEALAGATRRQSSPLVSALARAGYVDPSAIPGVSPAVITQRTYVTLDDEVRPDLILLWTSAGQAIEQWVEVKTGAGLSGHSQLIRYDWAQQWLETTDGVRRPPVVLLSPSDLRSEISMTPPARWHTRHWRPPVTRSPGWISWQSVVDAVTRTPGHDTLWSELVLFLKEYRMTREASFPITAREATSLGDAYALFSKAVELLQRVNREGKGRFPGATNWYASGHESPAVQRQFRDHGRFTLWITNGSKLGFVFGLEADDSGEATYTVWMEADPKFGDARASAHRLAQEHRLVERGWSLVHDGWMVVVAREHTVNLPTLDRAVRWFLDRFGELEEATLFDLQKQLTRDGAASAVEPGAQPEDEPEQEPQ